MSAEWGLSENRRRARFYSLTTAGRRQLAAEASAWRKYAEAVFWGVGADVSGRPGRLFRLPWRTRRQIHEDVDEELRFHLDLRIDALVALRLSREAAQREALREFGDVDDARRYVAPLLRMTTSF